MLLCTYLSISSSSTSTATTTTTFIIWWIERTSAGTSSWALWGFQLLEGKQKLIIINTKKVTWKYYSLYSVTINQQT